ncbi:MAG: hypothetical protein M1825_006365 [Sarcosagium campestre]|nr:MAG: hypothetical protein M1825_006365 [Sarcosagium campestre]
MQLLQAALESHRKAIDLEQDNADALFNTAQVLSSLGEVIIAEDLDEVLGNEEVTKLLQEAIELLQRCLTLQEFQLSEAQALVRPQDSALETNMSTRDAATNNWRGEYAAAGPEQNEDQEWASVVESVTADTLLDTAVVQLETLTALCATISPTSLAWVDEYASSLLKHKIIAYANERHRVAEAALARANFAAALADRGYKTGVLDMFRYEEEVKAVFYDEALDLSANAQGLCDRAESLMKMCSSIAGNHKPPSAQVDETDHVSRVSSLRWRSLTSALSDLSQASKLDGIPDPWKIHLARGDAEMLRYRLCHRPWNFQTAADSAATLLANAQVYYRGAKKLAKNAYMVEEEREGTVKEALAASLAGNPQPLQLLSTTSEQVLEVKMMIAEAIDDDLVDPSVISAL